ncbi:MAG: ATP-binding cassette domain-containing protein [Acutalibacteraceae bacterium]
MIKINNISKKFKDKEVLKNVSFKVDNGEIVGLLGENGAGKSTLLRIISTMLFPTSGNANINGLDLVKEPEKVRKQIGILFGSEVGLYDRLTARENLEYFARLSGMNDKEVEKRTEYLIDRFKFKSYADKQVYTFSKGMKQKVSIARSIVHDPSVMLFDEPDSGLDFKAARIIFNFMEDCKKEGKSIIFSSHSMENIKKYSDRIVVLRKGEILSEFNAEDYRKKYTEREFDDILFDLVCDGDDNDD